MDRPAEQVAIDAAVARLAARFPTLDRAHVAEVVSTCLRDFDSARVRDFIPVLVEHRAMELLRAEAEPAPLTEEIAEAVDDPRPQDPVRPDPFEVEGGKEQTGMLFGDLRNG